jgi:DNA-binding LacI/PurR family transcriptional regulator
MALVPPHKPGQTSLNLLDIDGALVIEPQAGDPQLAELLQQGLPVVSIGRPGGDNVNVPYVDLLSGPATQMLLTHMLAAGARQIGLVVGASERTSYSQAEQAYAAMAAGHGMRPVVLRMDEAEGEDGGHAAAQHCWANTPSSMPCWSWSMPLPWAPPATPSRQACAFPKI